MLCNNRYIITWYYLQVGLLALSVCVKMNVSCRHWLECTSPKFCLDLKSEIPKSCIQSIVNAFKSTVLLFQISDVSALQGCVQSWVCPRHFLFFKRFHWSLGAVKVETDFIHYLGLQVVSDFNHWSLNFLWNTQLKLLYRSLSHTNTLLWSSGVVDKMPPFLTSAVHVTAILLEKGGLFCFSKEYYKYYRVKKGEGLFNSTFNKVC